MCARSADIRWGGGNILLVCKWRSAVLSGSAASRAASSRLKPCRAKYRRSMYFSPSGDRSLPDLGAYQPISAHDPCHATIHSRVARNDACRVGRYYPPGAGIGRSSV